ncbi:lysine N(6)-hydroxylase/L-ornithine N(5)-oxygenase family protein [Pseudalkalibacillus salsuginis]|uniref:lysine N(6)-hydroxylase/L-ornithine N(5)-oxygenase family protein n=1 Tax=Pseudalkalibacillus salsuginis TaxID=2910972 RepID=UPI001F2D0D84|nr:lysine N(6)-hydroxylase/L-ornithine N(5)-oxygenase family protein [Pseudalkalibacillus salsuginis]MCF6409368.1 lysine N(6)-hydroxylase/L-ornithine N(5)-oxygenase family protein [Pseudalkalibacillus salsuginis]
MTVKEESKRIHDVIGIGIGPFNLGMAALLEEVPEIDALFFERKDEFDWHPGMLLDGTTLQVPFFADLVSMADVRSKYSFLHYLQEHDRIYHFYFLEKFHIPRKEYNHYCKWVSDQLGTCRFGRSVENVQALVENGEQIYEVDVLNRRDRSIETYQARHLLIGIGTSPSVPSFIKEHIGETVFHSSQFLNNRKRCLEAGSITVIGSGQSAAEVFYDLAKEQEQKGYSLDWYTRSKGFFPMEYSKLGLEYFSPDYTDFFYQLPQFKKDKLIQEQDLLYKGISTDTIAEIYDLLYERTVGDGKPDIGLQAMTEASDLKRTGDNWELEFIHRLTEQTFVKKSDVVILGTGYQPTVPGFLEGIDHLIDWDEHGRYQIRQNYELKMNQPMGNKIFIQNGELHTHGVGAPDLGLGAHRNAVIINSLVGREVYPVRKKNVFQTFGMEASCMPANV